MTVQALPSSIQPPLVVTLLLTLRSDWLPCASAQIDDRRPEQPDSQSDAPADANEDRLVAARQWIGEPPTEEL